MTDEKKKLLNAAMTFEKICSKRRCDDCLLYSTCKSWVSNALPAMMAQFAHALEHYVRFE